VYLLAYPRRSGFGVIVMAYHETAVMIMMIIIVIIYSINCLDIGRDHIVTQSPQ
jgi:hypothetical protein